MPTEHDESPRKAYEKPKVKRFPLRPEEAVLGFCKSTTSSGPSSSTCKPAGFCTVAGS